MSFANKHLKSKLFHNNIHSTLPNSENVPVPTFISQVHFSVLMRKLLLCSFAAECRIYTLAFYRVRTSYRYH